jgi:FkbM family methyltransferase
MLVNRHDINQTNALFKTGMAIDHAEIVLLSQVLQLLGTDLTVLDVGANFGTYTLGLAPFVGLNGKVHAFEPQRIIFNMLAGSIALGPLTNVFCHHLALGDREGILEIPQFNYDQPLNFGSIEFTPEQREPLHQPRGHDPNRFETVPLATLDSFAFPRVDLLKIDAEGMETQVLLGASETLHRCRPVLYLEFLKSDKEALRQHVLALDYAVHENGINFLCIPKEKIDKITIIRPPLENK